MISHCVMRDKTTEVKCEKIEALNRELKSYVSLAWLKDASLNAIKALDAVEVR